jgi:uncharacterized protein (TIGR02145 family)
MTVLITLTTAGIDAGPFDLYSNVDGYTTAFETGVSKSALVAGYTSNLVPNSTITVRVRSTGVCTNFIDIPIGGITTTTSSTSVNPCANCINHDVTVGSQIWTGCNLDVTTYRNGDVIPQVSNPTQWANLTTGAWCYYNNDPANGAIYGKLYNVYAIMDPRGLAPAGYHIPSDAEWTTLTATLGGGTWTDTWGTGQSFFQPEIGNLLKQANTCHWDLLSGQTDPYGFTALPGGTVSTAGTFNGEGLLCDFGSSTLTGFLPNETWYYRLEGFVSVIDKLRQTSTVGVSIRLVKD